MKLDEIHNAQGRDTPGIMLVSQAGGEEEQGV